MPKLLHAWFRPPRHLVVMFVLVTLVPSVLLMASGWRLLQQEREIDRQQAHARREQAVDLVASALEQGLAATEERLRSADHLEAVAATPDSVVVVFDRGQLREWPGRRLLYVPEPPALPQALPPALARGEELEFREQDPARAAAWFKRRTHSADPAVRAAALFLLGRNYRKLGAHREALAAWDLVAGTSDLAIDGIPADLLARAARCSLLAELNRQDRLIQEARDLRALLLGGRWRLDRATLESNLEQANGWAGEIARPPATATVLASTVQRLWARWRAGERVASREAVPAGESVVTVLAAGDAHRLVALVAGPDLAASQWLPRVSSAGTRNQLAVRLLHSDDHPSDLPREWTRRSAAASGLPWTILVRTGEMPAADGLTGRLRLWLAGLIILGALVLGGTYLVGRAVTRELEVARLHSDFVAAVSHEFRTPLTSLRQLSEMLLDRPHPPGRARSYYEALERQTERLHRLVESLLDFGRMEAGTSPYRLEPLDVSMFVREVVAEFQADAAARGHAIDVQVAGQVRIAADRDALANALWNLLDNAAKYSPGTDRIAVAIDRAADEVVISVRDEGFGISPAEQPEIFHKFVRGSRAKAEGIKGTGIGLAMVQHIASAHHGRVDVQSEPGAGTTFSLRLPVLRLSDPEGNVCLES